MSRYMLDRVIAALITIFIITSLSWIMIKAVPGGPFDTGKKVVPEIKAAMEKYYGLDKPVEQQYIEYMKNAVTGNLGVSFKFKNTSVNEIIARSFAQSAELGLKAVVVGFVFGLILGIAAALNHNKFIDRFSIFIAILGVSIPSFVLGGLLQYSLGVQLQILPVATWGGLEYQILPVFSLAFAMIAQVARYMRSTMLDVISQDYIKTAKAKGISQFEIIWRHEIRNAILPVITILGPWIAFVITGAFVVESIFAINALGKEYIDAIHNMDYTVITGLSAFIGSVLVFMNLFVDILYSLIDPRIKLSGSK